MSALTDVARTVVAIAIIGLVLCGGMWAFIWGLYWMLQLMMLLPWPEAVR